MSEGDADPSLRRILWADKMLFASILLLLVFTVLPILVFSRPELLTERIPCAACSAAIVMFAFYVPAVVVHYRRYFWPPYTETTTEPDWVERKVVGAAVFLATVIFLSSFWW